MSSDRELARIVQSWLQDREDVLPERVLDDVLDLVHTTPQDLPFWRAWRTRLMHDTLKFAAAGAVALVVAAGGLALYFSRPAVAPSGASPTPVTSQAPSVAPPSQAPTDRPSTPPPDGTVQPTPTGESAAKAPWVLFHWGVPTRTSGSPVSMAMRADGTEAHQIWDIGLPSFDWSADGTRVVAMADHIYLAEVGDEIGPFVDTGFSTEWDTACHGKSRVDFPCQDMAVDFSPDGEHIVFVQRCTYEAPGCYFLTVLDLTTGQRTELLETLDNRRHPIALPQFSPDGSQISFTRGEQADALSSVSRLYVVNTDGTNLHEIDLGEGVLPNVVAPTWSPDGTKIAFAQLELDADFNPITHDISMVDLTSGQLSVVRSCCEQRWGWPEWIAPNVIRLRASEGLENIFGVTEVVNSISPESLGRMAIYADLNGGLDAIEPAGEVSTVVAVADPGRIYYWQPVQDWPAEIDWGSFPVE